MPKPRKIDTPAPRGARNKVPNASRYPDGIPTSHPARAAVSRARAGSGIEQTGSNFGQRKARPPVRGGGLPVRQALQIKSAGPRKSPGGLVMRGGVAYSTRTGKPITSSGSSVMTPPPGMDFSGIGNAVKNFMGNVSPQDSLMKVVGKRIKKATSTGR